MTHNGSSSGSTAPARPATPLGCIEERVALRLMRAVADLALVLDERGEVQEVTAGEPLAAERGLGALKGRAWIDTVAPDSRAKAQQLLAEARAGERPRSREINQFVEGIDVVPFRFAGVSYDGDGGRVAVLGRDLRGFWTLQQQMLSAQQAMDREYGRLREAETRYRLLFQVSSEAVLVAEAGLLRIVEANPAGATLLDGTPQTVRGRPLEDAFAPGSWPAVSSLLAAIEAGGRAFELEVTLAGQPGRGGATLGAHLFRQWGTALLVVRLRPPDSDGIDVATGSRGSRLLAALEALPDGLVLTGEDLRVLSANTAFCDMAHAGNENQVIGQPLDRWLGRPGVDLPIILANLREHGTVRSFSTIVRGDYGTQQEAVVSAASATEGGGRMPCLGFSVRAVPPRLQISPPMGLPAPRSADQLRQLVGRAPLREIVRESADIIERLCIEAALKVSGNNRASAAQLLGLSRQGLYSKLRRYGLGDLDVTN